MKKHKIFIFSFVLSALFLIGCDKVIYKDIDLPSLEDIESIEITGGESKFASDDKNIILKLIENMSNATITNKESVQDVPNQEKYIKINLITKEYTSTFFVYWEDSKLYLEQPYVGIYLADTSLNEVINGIYDFKFKD
ncbi:hypothetical protein CHL78_008305 [Romboutsia weinsteinii]|uniref:DUF5301 domain-containing protein n=1 Tax=Romboutsia weinsteinii TaxID=2020949 RepID=A0A371J4U6_9FIRM|nr:DUF5301 domain-containing protein [Romboutsia weinsteinii]RDY27714.1 hypothetical protein CHL78_008305 [Romboutsia weinsteinii]